MRVKATSNNQQIDSPLVRSLKDMLINYTSLCKEFNTVVCTTIKDSLLDCIANGIPMKKFIVDPKDRKKAVYMNDVDFVAWLMKRPQSMRSKKKQKKRTEDRRPLVRILPLIEAIRNVRYVDIKQLCVYDVLIDHSDTMCLAGMLTKGAYLIESIELINCFMNCKAVEVLAPSVNFTQTLTHLVLDCNEFGDSGCYAICNGLANCVWLTVLSMCYCDLHKQSGLWLGELLRSTSVRELYLDGNNLECEGTIAMLYELSDIIYAKGTALLQIRRQQEEASALEAKVENTLPDTIDESTISTEWNTNDNAKGLQKKHRKKPVCGPHISVLRLAQNGIDQDGIGKSANAVSVIKLIKRIIGVSKDIKEIDLNHNDIGELSGRLLMEGLLDRLDAGLPKMSLFVAHTLNQDTYDSIQKLNAKSKRIL